MIVDGRQPLIEDYLYGRQILMENDLQTILLDNLRPLFRQLFLISISDRCKKTIMRDQGCQFCLEYNNLRQPVNYITSMAIFANYINSFDT